MISDFRVRDLPEFCHFFAGVFGREIRGLFSTGPASLNQSEIISDLRSPPKAGGFVPHWGAPIMGSSGPEGFLALFDAVLL
jgi:hypothetical protein